MAHRRYHNIDALRAFAATLVVVQHFFGDVILEAQDGAGPLVGLFTASMNSLDLGRLGVVLFFLISGFVVPFSIRGQRPLLRFAISRFFRLYPALWLAVLMLTIFFAMRGNVPSAAMIAANLTMLPGFMGAPWLLGAYWTLSIELIFYALCAILFWRGLLFSPRIVTVFALVLVGTTAAPIFARMGGLNLPVQYMGLHLSFLYCGLLLRLAMIDKLDGAWTGAAIVALTQLAVLLAIGDFSLGRNDRFFLVGKMPIITAYILAFVVFVCAVRSGKPQSKLLSKGGEISYSIYLFHGVAALVVYAFLPLTGGWRDLFAGFASLSLTMLLAWGVYRFLESPMIAFGHKMASLLEPPALQPQKAAR